MRWTAGVLAALALALPGVAAAQVWTPIWTASAAPPRFDGTPEAPLAYEDQTLRQDVRILSDGDALRVRFSNELGAEPVRLRNLRVRLLSGGADIPLTINGQAEAVLAPGNVLVSDRLSLAVRRGDTVVLQAHLPAKARGVVRRSAVRLSEGDEDVSDQDRLTRRQGFVSAVFVGRETPLSVVAALGDSITEGATSTLGAERDWPSRLQARLDAGCPGRYVVVNAGISGNQVVQAGRSPPATARLDRDILSLPGLTHVIWIEGINDIRHNGDPAQPGRDARTVIGGYRQVIDRLHAHGVKVIGGTVTPFGGSERFDDRSEGARQALNAFIRSPGAFDGVADFDLALRDPARPDHLLPSDHNRDWLHPNDAGYQKMADAVPLEALGCR